MASDDQRFCTCDEPEFAKQIRGGSLVVRCQRCGVEAVTTYYPPVWQDEQKYTIRVLSADNELLPLIKLLKNQEEVSTEQAREIIEQREPVFERAGSSGEILEIAKLLADQQIGYRCSPPYPHFLDYQIIAAKPDRPD